MTSDDVASLSDKSFDLMRAAFLDISDSITRSNGPVRHWTLIFHPPSVFSAPCLRSTPPQGPPTLRPRLSHRLQETMWHKSFCDESSSCLVDAWSGPPLAWAHSTVSPDPHCRSSSCSALCERSDGRRAEQSGCVLFMHAFWMALSTFHPCFGNLSFLIVLLYCCFLLFFGFLSSPAFVRFAFCSADKLCGVVFFFFPDHKCQWIFMFSSHAALVLVLFGCLNRHTQNQSTPSHFFAFSSFLFLPFMHSSLLPKDKNECGSPQSAERVEGKDTHDFL